MAAGGVGVGVGGVGCLTARINRLDDDSRVACDGYTASLAACEQRWRAVLQSAEARRVDQTERMARLVGLLEEALASSARKLDDARAETARLEAEVAALRPPPPAAATAEARNHAALVASLRAQVESLTAKLAASQQQQQQGKGKLRNHNANLIPTTTPTTPTTAAASTQTAAATGGIAVGPLAAAAAAAAAGAGATPAEQRLAASSTEAAAAAAAEAHGDAMYRAFLDAQHRGRSSGGGGGGGANPHPRSTRRLRSGSRGSSGSNGSRSPGAAVPRQQLQHLPHPRASTPSASPAATALRSVSPQAATTRRPSEEAAAAAAARSPAQQQQPRTRRRASSASAVGAAAAAAAATASHPRPSPFPRVLGRSSRGAVEEAGQRESSRQAFLTCRCDGERVEHVFAAFDSQGSGRWRCEDAQAFYKRVHPGVPFSWSALCTRFRFAPREGMSRADVAQLYRPVVVFTGLGKPVGTPPPPLPHALFDIREDFRRVMSVVEDECGAQLAMRPTPLPMPM